MLQDSLLVISPTSLSEHVSSCLFTLWERSKETSEQEIVIFKPHTRVGSGPGWRSRYSDSLRAGRSGDRIPLGDETFRSRPDRPWGPPSLLYNVYRVSFPGVKRPGRGASHPIPSSCRGSRTDTAIPLLPLLGPQGPL
jgi:hypothetical protein